MALTCPNINMPEWVALEAAVGKMEAYRDYMETDGLIRTPEEVQRKLDARGTSIANQLIDPEQTGIPIGLDIATKLVDALKTKFDQDIDSEILYDPTENWKGRVQMRNGRPTVVINTAYATLDTPMHEFGHIFLSMLKSNIRLYSSLMKNLAAKVDSNTETRGVYDTIERLYKDRFMDEVSLSDNAVKEFQERSKWYSDTTKLINQGKEVSKEDRAEYDRLTAVKNKTAEVENMLMDELMTELLGRYAAGHIDERSGFYKPVKAFWDAIVDMIKSIIGLDNKVDVLKITPGITLEQLGNMLAHPDIKFTSGTEKKRIQDEVEQRYINLLEFQEEALDRIAAYGPATGNMTTMAVGNMNYLMDKNVRDKVEKLTVPRGTKGTMIQEISKYLEDEFKKETERVFLAAYNANTTDTTAFLNKIEQDYPRWAYSLQLIYDQGQIQKVSNLLMSYASQSAEEVDKAHIRQEMDLVINTMNNSEVKELFTKGFDSKIQTNVMQALLSNSEPGLQRMFDAKAVYFENTGGAELSVDTMIESVNNKRIRNQERINRVRSGKLLKQSYSILNPKTGKVEEVSGSLRIPFSSKDPVTGAVEEDVIELDIRETSGNGLYISFGSKIWEYQDPTFAYPVTDRTNLKVGETEVALKNNFYKEIAGRKTYLKQGVYLGNSIWDSDKVIITTRTEQFGRDARELNDVEITEFVEDAGYPDEELVDTAYYYEVSRSALVELTAQQDRSKYLMNKIIDGIAQMTAGMYYDRIKFSPAPGQTMDPAKADGLYRDKLYKIYGVRTFGRKYHNELLTRYQTDYDGSILLRQGQPVPVAQHTVLIPHGFRNGLVMSSDLYQKTDPTSENNTPFGKDELEESVMGQAILNDASENKVEPVLTDQSEAVDLAKQMSEQLGVNFQFVTATEAQALTANAENPWKAGDIAFFIGDTVYFVGDHITTETVFHEFSHPFLRHIAKTNPALFNKLYDQLAATPEGAAFINDVRELYPDLEEGSDMFKEEVMVRALTAAGMDQMNNLKTESGFAKVIKNIMYAIKQALRKLFGKVPVSGLTSSTTLKDLADMLVKGGKFEVDKSLISQEDLVAYNKERTEYIDALINVEDETVQDILNRAYSVASDHINKLLTNRNYDALADILTDADKRGDLQEMKSNIQAYQTTVSNMANQTLKDMEHVKNRSTALVNSIFRLRTVMDKILEHAKDMRDQGETQDNLHKAYYYDHLVKHWDQFLNESIEALKEQEVYEDSPMLTLLRQIKGRVESTQKIINKMYADGARDALYDQMLPTQEAIKTRYEAMIQNLVDKGAPQAKIDRFYSQYHGVTMEEHERMRELKRMRKSGVLPKAQQTELDNLVKKSNKGIAITPEKIEEILKGNMGDANFFNSYLEGYLYNTDPVIGGLASYVKDHLNEVMAKAQGTYNDFSKEMQPILQKAGFNPLRPGDLGERLGFLDKVAKKDDKGNLVERLVWTFKNPFKNYRYDYDVHKKAVEDAQFEYNRTGTTEAEKAMKDAVVAMQKFRRDYFHQEYVSEFYERDQLFEKDEIGKSALLKRKQWGERYRALTEPANTPEQQLEITGQVEMMWREWRQMSSIYDLDGQLKTGEDRDIALRIKEYNDLSRPFYETKERKGVFQSALRLYEQQLIDEGDAQGSDAYIRKRKIWIDQNTVRVPKQTWYDRTRELYARQAEIYAKLDPSQRQALNEQKIMDQIFDLQGGFRDEYGQTKANEMTPEARAKVMALEEELNDLREAGVNRNGLTPEQNELFNQLHEIRIAGSMTMPDGTVQTWGPHLQAKLTELYNIKDTMGLSKFELDELDSIKAELEGISKREATSYYVDIMNNWLGQLNIPDPTVTQINKKTADWVLEPNVINQLLGQNAEFDAWFKASHIQKLRFNPETKLKEPVWVRSKVWSQTIPIDPSQYETFELRDEKGNVVETIQGKPIQKYYTRSVKPEFRTEKVVGVTVDNKYNWLPKTVEQGAKDSLYINEEYEAMKSNPDEFRALEKMKEWHLKNQDGISNKGRLYYDFPRYRKENLELAQSKNFLTNIAQRIKDFFRWAKDAAESGYNDVDQFNLIRMDIFDNEITDVPIHGLYDIDHEDVSTDITLTMMQYMLSGERQKQLVKISPLARAVQSVATANKLNKTDSKGFEFVNKFNFLNNRVMTFGKQKGDSIRKKAIDNFIEREFEGKRMTGAASDVPWLNNTQSLLFKRASFGFFAFNIPSALKNSYGAKFQGLIEASAGEHMTQMSFQKGNAWSYATMGELSFGGQLYQKGPKSLRQQIVEVFDPSQGRFEDNFGEGMSRTLAKDAASFSWLYNFRKWVELQATLQIFGGMMYHQKVTQKQPDGTEKEIAYLDAWELRDEKIQLKEGVDPAWGITYNEEGEMKVGKKFSRYKNTMHQVMNNLQGAYASFDQPEAQRYLVFRFLSYLRRYFTTMTLNRFGFSGRWSDPKPRLNPGLGDVQMGFYIQFIQTVKDTVTSLGRNLMYLTEEEKKAAFKVMTEMASLVAINLAMALLFGWDPDDDERFEKLRARSGALPFPMTSEDPDRPFNGWGFVENHMLMLLMNVRSENEQFLPFPGYGLDDYSAMLDLKSIAFGPTVQTYKEIFEDALDILQGNESAYYKREVGPYEWQQEGGAKIWAHIARTLGLTGSALDPAKSIKGFQSVQARARR